jgi:HK97 gp10 family phage protein
VAGQAATVKFSEQSFQADIRRAVSRLKIETEAELVGVALSIQNDARRYCPVDTGRLRASITASPVQRLGGRLFIWIGTNVEYAPFVEYGTRFMAAQPYLRPGFLHGTRHFTAALRRAAKAAGWA